MPKTNEPKQPAAEAPAEHKETTAEFVASMASVLVIGIFIITFCLQAFEIPSASMENTLLIGDHVFVDRVRLAPEAKWIEPFVPYRAPRHGDIVVFKSVTERDLHVVKRIIGVPGDRIHLKDGVVYINGVKQDEPYLSHLPPRSPSQIEETYRNNFPAISPEATAVDATWLYTMRDYIHNGELVVPEGSYFGMGDNRENSYDSRYWGFIPQENVIGRPMFIHWSFETPEDQYMKQKMADRVAFLFDVVIHFGGRTRWSRMLHRVR